MPAEEFSLLGSRCSDKPNTICTAPAANGLIDRRCDRVEVVPLQVPRGTLGDADRRRIDLPLKSASDRLGEPHKRALPPRENGQQSRDRVSTSSGWLAIGEP